MTAPAQRDAVGQVAAAPITVMSYNVRVDIGAGAGHPDHWPARAPALTRALAAGQPSLLGVQEPLRHQVEVLQRSLGPRYARVGEGRDADGGGEHGTIFYDVERFRALEHGQYWLSETPDVAGSLGWGATLPRIAVWLRVQDLVTGRRLLHINSHLDHASEQARRRGAELIAAQAIATTDPVIVTADANAAAGGSVAYDLLTRGAGLQDTWRSAQRRLTPRSGTFTDYRSPAADGERIDWILASPPVQVLAAAIGGASVHLTASDHLPVRAVLALA